MTQTLENNDVDQEMRLPMTEVEKERLKVGISKETITVERIWNKRPDGFTIKKPTKTKTGELVTPEFKRMSCLTDQYVTRTRNVEVAQYVSIKSTLERTLTLQGWTVSQKSFITGTRSVNEKELHDSLYYFKVPETGIESISSKLSLKYLTNMQIF